MTMEKIFYYTDFRRWLADYYSGMKKNSTAFSYRWFAKKAGLSSSGLYQRVVKGERNLTAQTVEQFVAGMDLTDREAAYFRALVGFGQAKTATEKQDYYSTMASMAEFVAAHQMESSEYVYLSRWYLPVLRELVVQRSFTDNYDDLANSVEPAITVHEAKKGIDLLLRIGYLQRSDDGRYVQRDKAISAGESDERMLATARRSFNRQMIQLAAESLDRFPVDKRYARGLTVGISKSCYDVITQEIDAFAERIALLVDRDRGERVVSQINIQLFPLTKENEITEGEE